MSMNATDDVVRRSATLRATVDLPEPDPPAIPIISGLSIEGAELARKGCAAQ